jgi:hypothetical protein
MARSAATLRLSKGGIAADGGPGRDVRRDAGLGGGDGAVADGAVAGDADLAGEDDVLADVGGPGEADLGAEQRVFADDEPWPTWTRLSILAPACDAGFADGGAVDGGVGLDLDVVFEDGGAGLEDLVPGGRPGSV